MQSRIQGEAQPLNKRAITSAKSITYSEPAKQPDAHCGHLSHGAIALERRVAGSHSFAEVFGEFQYFLHCYQIGSSFKKNPFAR